MDLVTVIIPTYKRSDKIERAIKSAINQTYKNIEIIVIDDNANFPEEREKTKKIVSKYENIKFIENEENLGGALTRNVGIDNAQGKYIAFLDDDDEFISNKIERQMELMKQKEKDCIKVGMVYCYKNGINSEGKTIFTTKIDYEGNCLFQQMIDNIETTSTWICPKEVLIKVGKFENVKAHQDNILLTKILANGYEIYRVPEILLNLYLHDGNGITNRNKNYAKYTETMIEFKKKYMDLLNDEQKEIIKYTNSVKLMNLYYENSMKKEYKEELKKVLKNNKFRKNTIKLIVKTFFIKNN